MALADPRARAFDRRLGSRNARGQVGIRYVDVAIGLARRAVLVFRSIGIVIVGHGAPHAHDASASRVDSTPAPWVDTPERRSAPQ